MKIIALFIGMIFAVAGWSQTPSGKIQTTFPSTTTNPLPAPQQKTTHRETYVKREPPPLLPQQLTYFHPGIIVNRNGRWEGADNLLNISKNIGVFIDVLQPEKDPIHINSEEIKKKVEGLFARAGIFPTTLATSNQPPLPAFLIKILLYPIGGGYVAYCEGRLFESVSLNRFSMDAFMAFQAITWQRQSLIVAPQDKLIEYLESQVEQIAHEFIDVNKTFDERKRMFMQQN